MAQQIIRRAIITGETFKPWDVPGLGLMLHAPYEGGGAPSELAAYAQNPSIAAGDPVQTVTDWSGTEHPTQSTLAFRPSWESGKIGGKHAFEFDGVDDNWISNITTTEDVWIAGVVERTTGAAVFLMQAGIPASGLPDHTGWWIYPSSANILTRVVNAGGDAARRYGTWPINRPPARINAVLASAGAEQDLLEDDISLMTGPGLSSSKVMSLTSRPFTIGGRRATGGYAGTIGSLLIFTEQPSAENKSAINTWLDQQWGL